MGVFAFHIVIIESFENKEFQQCAPGISETRVPVPRPRLPRSKSQHQTETKTMNLAVSVTRPSLGIL